MWKYVIKRIFLAFITAFIVLSLTFIVLKLLPFDIEMGKPQQTLIFMFNQEKLGYVENVGKIIPSRGEPLFIYDDMSTGQYYVFYQTPILTQYFRWLANVAHGDWGLSTKVQVNVPVTDVIINRFPITIKLNIIAMIVSVPIGIGLGILAALKKNKATDHIISTLIMIFISIPSFIMITFVISLFSYNLGWFPSMWPKSTDSEAKQILGYFIPVFCLSFGSIAGYARFVRAELCEILESEYLLLARTKGLTRKQAIIRHALKNAMVPILPAILGEFIGILGGSMILENIYGIAGVGVIFVDALNAKDYNLLLCTISLYTTIGLLAGLIIDLSYGFIDPRIRMGGKK